MDNKNDLKDTVIKTETKQNRQAYMREYKKKQYMTKGEDIKEKNKAYYYKKKLNMSEADLKKYDVLLPIVAKLQKNIEELRDKNSDMLNEILISYIKK
jgi:hypothetical protein